MPRLTYAGAVYQSEPGENVLHALLRGGAKVSHSCQAGACQACLLRLAAGVAPAAATRGLKPSLVEQGCFLSCVCLPEGDLELSDPAGVEVAASIASIERLSDTVVGLRLRTAVPFEYRAGQYIILRRPDGLARSYSLASLPGDETLELHVRRAPQGRMTGWLFDEARPGDAVSVRGPAGDCFYVPGKPEQPLLLAGVGSGLAPLYGVCKDALSHGHTGPIFLYHGSVTPAGLYLRRELSAMAIENPNFKYVPAVLQDGDIADIETGALDRIIGRRHPRLTGWRGFAGGDPAFVQAVRKVFFLAGMNSQEIFSDSYLEAAV